MVRQALKKANESTTGPFRLRGMDHTRIEGLSDGVFAIAIALLLISSSPPQVFADLMVFMYDFVPFAATITLLMMLWYEHYTFFVKYGLKDTMTVFLNTILLFLILFYVYPMKFLFKVLFELFSSLITRDWDRFDHLFSVTILPENTPTLMVIYGLGAAAIFGIFALLYAYAYRKKSLELNVYERYETRSSIIMNIVSGMIPILSAIVAAVGVGGDRNFMISGMTYWLYPIVLPITAVILNRGKQRLLIDTNDKE